MKNIWTKRQSIMISFAVLFMTLLLPAHFVSAGNLDECLLEALKKADESVTVGQIRGQCQQSAEAGVVADSSGSSSSGPEEIILKTHQARKPAYFPHKKHQERYDCGTCHHGASSSGSMVQYSEEMVIKKCTACHNPDMPNKDLNGLQAIGHQLCRECHRTNQDITKATCSTCHRKNL